MSSSTSSSEPAARGRKLRIALMITAVLVLIEWGTRTAFMPGTSDLIRYRAFSRTGPRPRLVARHDRRVHREFRNRSDTARRREQRMAGAHRQAPERCQVRRLLLQPDDLVLDVQSILLEARPRAGFDRRDLFRGQCAR